MISLTDHSVYLSGGGKIIDPSVTSESDLKAMLAAEAIQSETDAASKTMAYQILQSHNESNDPSLMRIKFDALISHDITYVGIIQSARVGGLKAFPLPYALTNCHNSLCAVGGTINEDDHVFGLSAAKKYGGIYVPANMAVIHQYAREMLSGCGKMILGSDSHTRYGCFGTLGIGEGGPELVKQLLSHTYDIKAPEVVLVWLEGAPRPGVGPHDVAIALVKAVFKSGFVKNKILEFAGPGADSLSIDFRSGIDVMTTETTCLSSIWVTDDTVKDYFETHKRPEAFRPLKPGAMARYDAMVRIDLSSIESMIALPFHPGNAFTIHELLENPKDILRTVEKDASSQFGNKVTLTLTDKVIDGKIMTDQGIIAGCAGGTFENLCAAADILRGASIGNDFFTMSVYPSSMPVFAALTDNGIMSTFLKAGVVAKMPFCGPCFGAGDVPANDGFSIRHTTRNFPNREGSKPEQGQLACVALMDARSIAATGAAQGVLTAATDLDIKVRSYPYRFDSSIYEKRCYNGFNNPQPKESLRLGPNITDWPKIMPLPRNLIIDLAAVIHDPVTTTDELIPSGETSSYRSNPMKLAEFTLSRREPQYVPRAKEIRAMEQERQEQKIPEKLINLLSKIGDPAQLLQTSNIGSAIYANKPGDGSAREQAASCQKVLGGCANIAQEYATKRYRSNCINWGIIPFTIAPDTPFNYVPGDLLYIPDIRNAIELGKESIQAKIITSRGVSEITLYCKGLTAEEKQILLDGCLMNYYAPKN